jgi:hypothetical protein
MEKQNVLLVSGMLAVVLVFGVVLAGCSEKANPPEDFDFAVEGTAFHIGRYKGSGLTPRIPSEIWGKKVTRILEEAFERKGLTGVTIPKSVTSIGDLAFFGNELTSVTIPDSVTSIGESAFHHNQLTSVTIGNGVASIGDWAFSYNQLTSVTIGANVELDSDSFDDNFGSFYDDNGKKAGTYTRKTQDSGNWSYAEQ